LGIIAPFFSGKESSERLQGREEFGMCFTKEIVEEGAQAKGIGDSEPEWRTVTAGWTAESIVS